MCISFEGWKQETDSGSLSKVLDFSKCAPFNTKGKDPDKKICSLSYAPLYIEILGALGVILFVGSLSYYIKQSFCPRGASSDTCKNEIVVQHVSGLSTGSSSYGPSRTPVRSTEIGLTATNLHRKSDPVFIGESANEGKM